MIPANHPNRTRRLGAPLDWNADKSGPCGGLAIADIERAGLAFMESLWEPLPEELEALKAGGKVILNIQGRSHPVVSVGVTAVEPETAELSPIDRHNAVAPSLLIQMLTECPKESEALVVLESLVLGVMIRFRPVPFEAETVLGSLLERVITRLAEERQG